MYVDLQRVSDTVSVYTTTTLTPMPSARSHRPVRLAAAHFIGRAQSMAEVCGGQSQFTLKALHPFKSAWLRVSAMGWDVGSCSGPRTDELRSMFSDLEGCWAALSAIMREGPKKLWMPKTALTRIMAVGALTAAVPPSHRAPSGDLAGVPTGRRTAPTDLGRGRALRSPGGKGLKNLNE